SSVDLASSSGRSTVSRQDWRVESVTGGRGKIGPSCPPRSLGIVAAETETAARFSGDAGVRRVSQRLYKALKGEASATREVKWGLTHLPGPRTSHKATEQP